MPLDLSKSNALLIPVRGFKRLLREWFTTAAAGPLTTPRACEPGPGTLTLTQSAANLAISGGELVLSVPGVPAWSGMGLRTASFPRKGGTVFTCDVRRQAGNTMFGLRTDTSLDTSFRHAFYLNTVPTIQSVNPTLYTLDPALVADARLQFAIVVRAAAGAFWFVKRGSGNEWQLVHYDETGNEATLYAALANLDGTHQVSNMQMVEALWLPSPLASETFNRANSASLGSTDGAGTAEANGGSGLAWSQVSGAMQISTNRLMLSGAAPGLPQAAISVVDAASADVLIRASINVAAGEATTSVVFRYTDNNNFWVANFATGAATIAEIAAGTSTTRATGAVITAGVRDIEVIVDGLRAILRVDGANYLAYGMPAAATAQLATKHGIRLAGATAYCDNFVIFNRRHRIRNLTRGRNLVGRTANVSGCPYDASITWGSLVNVSNTGGDREYFVDAINYRIRQTGLITRVKFWNYNAGGGTQPTKLILRFWREVGSLYQQWNYIGETADLATLTSPGVYPPNFITLPTPIAVRENDRFSILINVDAAGHGAMSCLTDRTFPAQVYYTNSPPVGATYAPGGSVYLWRDKIMFNAKTYAFSGTTVTCASHGYSAGDPVAVNSTGSVPSPLYPGTTVYVGNVATNTFTLHTSSAAGIAGTGALTLTGGSGTQSVGKCCNVIQCELDFAAPQLVCVGDSLTSGSITHNSTANVGLPPYTSFDLAASYPYQLGALRGMSYQNMGTAGNTSTQIQARFAADVIALKPAAAIILAGTNDISQGVAQATYLANMKAMLDACSDNAIVPIVISIPPSSATNNALAANRDGFNTALITLCRAYSDATYVDVTALLGTFRAGGTAGNLWDLQSQYNSGDGTHLNQAGYAVLAAAIAAAL